MEIKYKVLKDYGTIGKDKKGWTKKLVLMNWKDGEPKLDIRGFGPDGTPGKRIGLTEEEIPKFKDLVSKI